MKKYLTLASVVIGLGMLAGCSSTGAPKVTVDSIDLTVTPEWSLSETNLTPWGEVSDEKPIQMGGVEIIPSASGASLASPNNLVFTDTTTGCTITGLINYTDSYKATRGDTFNSKDYLYNLAPETEDFVSNETIETIHEIDYVVGEYAQPKSWGENRFHKTAVRVFGTVLPIENINESALPKNGPHKSDPTKGLVVATIDYACSTEKALTEAQWNEGIKHFQLLLTAEEIKAVNFIEPSVVPEGEEHSTTDIPTEEELENIDKPTVYDELIPEEEAPTTEEPPVVEETPED